MWFQPFLHLWVLFGMVIEIIRTKVEKREGNWVRACLLGSARTKARETALGINASILQWLGWYLWWACEITILKEFLIQIVSAYWFPLTFLNGIQNWKSELRISARSPHLIFICQVLALEMWVGEIETKKESITLDSFISSFFSVIVYCFLQ